MTDTTYQPPPDIDFSSFDFTNQTNSFLSDQISASSTGEKYLVFFFGEDFYAIASETVAEAAPYPNVVALPNAPEWLLGIANLRGEIISVVNLPFLLNKTASTVSAKSKIIVMRPQSSDNGFAFAADKLCEIIVLREPEIETDEKKPAAYIYGKAAYKSKVLNLIDTKKIYASLVL
jgi:purine-binding chemotaxis protein CheW